MNVLRNDCPDRGMERVCKRQDLKTVRWYVLTLPTAAGGRRDRISPSRGLDAELSRRERRGSPAVQLRVYPVLGGGDLPDEADAPLI